MYLSRRVRENLHFILLLSSSQQKQRYALIKSASHDQLTTIFEIFLNILLGCFHISLANKKLLKKYEDFIVLIANKNEKIEKNT